VELIIRIWKSENFFFPKSGKFGPFFSMESLNYIFQVEILLLNIKQLSHGFLSVQAAIGKEHRHKGKYICVKFGYVAQSTMNLPSCQHKTRAFIAKKMY
jgi:hypothetical protein